MTDQMMAKYKTVITAGVMQIILESGMKPQNASKNGLCLVCTCDYEASIYSN